MSPWPGAPSSENSPPINPPSMRFPFSLSDKSTMAEVADAVRTAYNGLTVHEQAFAAIPAQIASQSKTAATEAVTQIISQETVQGVTSFNSQTGSIIYFPMLGMVNDQLGNPSYFTQTSDAGKKIIVGDSSLVTVTLNPSVMLPWFTLIGNDSSANVVLMPGSGAGFYGIESVYPGGFAIVYYDGSTFWSEGVAVATDSTFGVVRPDGGTIVIDSTTGSLRTGGLSATIITAKLTSGGTEGSMTYSKGVLIAQTPAT